MDERFRVSPMGAFPTAGDYPLNKALLPTPVRIAPPTTYVIAHMVARVDARNNQTLDATQPFRTSDNKR